LQRLRVYGSIDITVGKALADKATSY